MNRVIYAIDQLSKSVGHAFAWCIVILTLGTFVPSAMAQSVSASERDALTRVADEAAAKGLPSTPLTNKIQEGIAKGYSAARIEQVVRQMASQLEAADQLLRELDPTASGPGREVSVTMLAESLGSSQQNVSKHLGALAEAGILGRRKEGNRVYYWITDESVFALCEEVCGSLQVQLRALNELVEGVSR